MAAQSVTDKIFEALADPRLSARRIMAAQPSGGEALSMAMMLGVALASQLILLKTRMSPDASPLMAASGGELAVATLLTLPIVFYVSAGLIWGIGSNAGGQGGWPEIRGLVAWWFFVQAVIAIALSLAAFVASQFAPPILGLIGLIELVVGLYLIYVMAVFAAEAHGFENVGSVLVALIGGSIGLAFMALLIGSIVAGPLPQQ